MKEIKAPNTFPSHWKEIPWPKYLFLAGSIEMGSAEKWQEKAVRLLKDTDWIILNPRRDDWDASWIQNKDNAQFRQQVEWELDGLEMADKILLYFDRATMSPISLLELGLFGWLKKEKMIVVCPDGFWKKGNVDIVCERYGIPQAETLEEAIKLL